MMSRVSSRRQFTSLASSRLNTPCTQRITGFVVLLATFWESSRCLIGFLIDSLFGVLFVLGKDCRKCPLAQTVGPSITPKIFHVLKHIRKASIIVVKLVAVVSALVEKPPSQVLKHQHPHIASIVKAKGKVHQNVSFTKRGDPHA